MRWAILITTLGAILFNFTCSGSYVRTGQTDHYTYWVGGYSTSVSFVLLAVTTFAVFGTPWKRLHRAATLAYFVTWFVLMAFSAWIISHPEGPHISSTMALAVTFTAGMYMVLCGLSYVVALTIGCLLPQPR